MMKFGAKTYIIVSALLCMLSCVKEVQKPSVPQIEDGDIVKIELFTRLNSFNVPVSRASANETTVDKDPWVLVFEDNGSGIRENANYVESAKTEIIANKSYVSLGARTAKCWIIILANPQEKFYIGTAGFAYSTSNFNSQLAGKTMAEAASMLLTMPLSSSNVVNQVPFLNKNLLMSYATPSANPFVGINSTTKIGTASAALKMTRSVAKVVVENTASGFTLAGATSIENMNNSTVLHNLNGALSIPATRVDYKPVDTANDFLAVESEPIYIYEYEVDHSNKAFLIVKGEFEGADYFYKLAILDDTTLSDMDIVRNTEYTFTITSVTAPGYTTYEDAKIAPPSNAVKFTITVVDPDSYEMKSNSEFYFAVSNRHTLIYNQGQTSGEYVAFTIVTNCATQFPNDNYIKIDNSSWLELVSPAPTMAGGVATAKIPVADNVNTPKVTEVKVRIKPITPNPSPIVWQEETIYLKVGNLTEEVTIKWQNIISSDAKTIKYYSGNNFEYYILSGEIDSSVSWMNLKGSDGIYRENTSSLTVEDGKLDIDLTANPSTASRSTTAMLTTVRIPATPATDEESVPRRVKMFISQGAFSNTGILYLDAEGKLQAGQNPAQEDMMFFKFGSVVGFHNNNDAWDMNYIVFNPATAAPTSFANIPFYEAADFTAGQKNVSDPAYHNGANVKLGKGDPCKLAGLSGAEIKAMSDAEIGAYQSGWRLPTPEENATFVGAPASWYGTGDVNERLLNTDATFWADANANVPGYRNGGWFPIPGDREQTTGRTTINNDPAGFLPAAGFRRAADGQGFGGLGYYWSSVPYDDAQKSYYLLFRSDTGGLLYPHTRNDYGYAFAVRCVRQ